MAVDALLAQAVKIARDAALGGTRCASALITLGDDGPPRVLFLELDGGPDSARHLPAAIDQFVGDAPRWLLITEASLQLPGLPAETDLVRVLAHADGEERTMLLRTGRDHRGCIAAVEPVWTGSLDLACRHQCN